MRYLYDFLFGVALFGLGAFFVGIVVSEPLAMIGGVSLAALAAVILLAAFLR